MPHSGLQEGQPALAESGAKRNCFSWPGAAAVVRRKRKAHHGFRPPQIAPYQPVAEVRLWSGWVTATGHHDNGKPVVGRRNKDDRCGLVSAEEECIGQCTAATSLGVPAPISSRIRIPRLWPAT